MKYEKGRTFLSAAALGSLLAAGVPGCLVTAFDLPVTDLTGLLLGCILAAVTCAALFSFRHGGMVFLCLTALGLGWLWREGELPQQLWHMAQTLLSLYDRAYGLGLQVLTETEAQVMDLPLLLIGSAAGGAAVWCQCRQGSTWLPVLAGLLPLSLCIVVTDTVPDEGFLFPVLLALLLLLFTGTVRQESGSQGLRLTAAAALPMAVGLAVLFLTVPQKGYVNQTPVIRENILTAARNLPQLLEEGAQTAATHLRGAEPRQLDLENLGARIPFTYPVMEVTADFGGDLYLRGRDYEGYDGLRWSSAEERRESFSIPGAEIGTVTIRTSPGKQLRYLPYYPAEETVLAGGMADNPGKAEEYTLSRTQLPEDWRLQVYQSRTESVAADLQRYLTLPEDTRTEASLLLEDMIDPNAPATEKADIIAAYVTDCARYDLNAEKMPAQEPDFALWFLKSAESGYCVHFATAATVLLRAADVPARYVTGYLTEITPGGTVTVTEENAHAWAEYYEPSLGLWIPLEATPAADPEPVGPAADPTVATEETEEPSAPTESVTEEPLATAEPETIPVHTESTQPPAEQPPKPSELLNWLKYGALTVLAMVFLAVQRSVRRSLRRRKQRSGNANRQALARWQEAERLSRLLKESPTEELMVLAQKARFSQHEITQQELGQFDSYIRSCLRRLKERPWYLRLVYQYVYAVY